MSDFNYMDWVKSAGINDRECLSNQLDDLQNAAKCRYGRINAEMSGALKHDPKFEMLPGALYFINSRYFADFSDCYGLEKNRVLLSQTKNSNAAYVTGYRPYAYAFTDEAGLHWMAPVFGWGAENIRPPMTFLTRAGGNTALVKLHKMCPVSTEYLYCPAISVAPDMSRIGKQTFLENKDKFLLYAKVTYRNAKSEIDMDVPLERRSITCEAEKVEKKLLKREQAKYMAASITPRRQRTERDLSEIPFNSIESEQDWVVQDR